MDAVKRGTFDRQIPIAVRQQGAVRWSVTATVYASTLMPVVDVSVDEDHPEPDSFTERARTLVREWLRLLADRGVDPLKLNKHCLNPASVCGR